MKFDVFRDDNVSFNGEIAGGRVQIWGPNDFTASGSAKADGRIELSNAGKVFATGHFGDRGRIEFTDHTGARYHGMTKE